MSSIPGLGKTRFQKVRTRKMEHLEHISLRQLFLISVIFCFAPGKKTRSSYFFEWHDSFLRVSSELALPPGHKASACLRQAWALRELLQLQTPSGPGCSGSIILFDVGVSSKLKSSICLILE